MSESAQALKPVLTAVSEEVAALSDLGERLQHLVGRLMSAGLAAPQNLSLCPETLADAQRLDEMVQRLSGLAIFLEGVADVAPAHWRLEVQAAARDLLLSSQTRRLLGTPEPAVAAAALEADAFESGAFEAF